MLMKLGAGAAARAADLVLDAEEKLTEAQQAALDEINATLDRMSENNEWDDKQTRKALLNSLSRIKAGKEPRKNECSLTEAVGARLSDCLQRLDSTSEEFYSQYDASLKESSKALRSVARDRGFKAAVIWQNRQAYRTAIEPLLKTREEGLKRDTKTRQREELIANYLQRYCAKNDTIGFFGPVGWAEFASEGDVIRCSPGRRLVDKSTVYFESWSIEALGKRIAEALPVKPWLTPIRMPFIRLGAGALHHPTLGSTNLTRVQAAVLRLCDGRKTTREIARELLATPIDGLRTEEEVCSVLQEMARKGYVFWDFNIGLSAFPEKTLRGLLNLIEEQSTRQQAFAALNELEAARSEVVAAQEDPEKLDSALANLDSVFIRLTGEEPTRAHGQTYAARTLVYEDCVRDVEINLGPAFFESLSEPLSLLLTSARWFTYEAAKVFRAKLQDLYEGEVRKSGSAVVDLAKFWMSATPYFAKESTLIKPLLTEFKRRWEKVLSRSAEDHSASFSSEQLQPLVEAEFPAPYPGWSGARYHSPDIMLVAASVEAINRGEYELVMGEFHMGSNTLAASLFYHQHPFPSSLIAAVESDLPDPRIIPVPPKDHSKITSRTNYLFTSSKDHRVEFGRDGFAQDRQRALPMFLLEVEEVAGSLIVGTRDRELSFDAVEFFSSAFSDLVTDTFKVLLDNPHTPRTSIDRLIISREAWRFQARDIDLAFGKDEGSRYLELRQWARSSGLPRFVFAKVPVEPKPVYVDLDSPIYVNLFYRKIQQTVESDLQDDAITVTEMLPAPHQAWLSDAEGRRYTSELRIVALDRTVTQGSQAPFSRGTAA
jgi:hypothetical protein